MGSSRIAFANLRAEMARDKVTILNIAKAIGVNRSTTGDKLAMQAPITLEEAYKISTLFPGKSIQYLFSEVLQPEERGMP